MHKYTAYFRKPLTGELLSIQISSEIPYQANMHEEYMNFVMREYGVPVQVVLIRVK